MRIFGISTLNYANFNKEIKNLLNKTDD